MSIGATLLGQMITFALFVLFTMKFVWPPLVRALHERQSRIAAGIAAGERGQNELEQAEVLIKQKLQEGRLHASQIIDEATKRANAMIDEAKVQARQEAARILAKAESEVEQMAHDLRETLRKEVSGLAMSGAQKILSRSVNSDVQKAILDRMIEEV